MSLQQAYRSSMLKAFKKTLDEGVFSFVIGKHVPWRDTQIVLKLKALNSALLFEFIPPTNQFVAWYELIHVSSLLAWLCFFLFYSSFLLPLPFILVILCLIFV